MKYKKRLGTMIETIVNIHHPKYNRRVSSPTRPTSALCEFESRDLCFLVEDRVLPELPFVGLSDLFKIFNDLR